MEIKKEKIKLKYDNFVQAVATLSDALDYYQEILQDREIVPDLNDKKILAKKKRLQLLIEDSCIQRFEYCTDMFWKYLKIYLEVVHEIVPEIASPKNSIRLSASIGILTEEQVQLAIEMIECRNMTSHMYSHDIVQEILDQMPAYHALMKLALQKMKP